MVRISLGVESGDLEVRRLYRKTLGRRGPARLTSRKSKPAGLGAERTDIGWRRRQSSEPQSHVERTVRLIESLELGAGDFVFLLDEKEFGEPDSMLDGLTRSTGADWLEQQARLKEALAAAEEEAASRCFLTRWRSNGHECSRFEATELLIDENLMDRMVRAVERVRERMHRAADVLEQAGIPYAVIGGNAVAAHVGRVDESAVRNTQDVDILFSARISKPPRPHWPVPALSTGTSRESTCFSTGPNAKARERSHHLRRRESPIRRCRARARSRRIGSDTGCTASLRSSRWSG